MQLLYTIDHIVFQLVMVITQNALTFASKISCPAAGNVLFISCMFTGHFLSSSSAGLLIIVYLLTLYLLQNKNKALQ